MPSKITVNTGVPYYTDMQLRVAGWFLSWCVIWHTTTADCPNGWLHYDNSCYRLSHDTETWLDANEVCRMDKAYLAEINSAKENNFVKAMLAARNINAWTGGSDIGEEGQWQWYSNDGNVSYVNWLVNQPDNGNGGLENCLLLMPNGFWNDLTCTSFQQYVCELPLAPSTEIIG